MDSRVSFLYVLIILLWCVDVTGAVHEGEEATVLTAFMIDEPVVIDGVADETAWNEARDLVIPIVDGKVGDVEVVMKALYDEDYIYFYVQWPDPTQSDTIFWNYSNGTWYPPAKTTEDIFSLFWNINESVRGYNIAGCSVTCHADRMRTNRPGEIIDYWKWKAEKGNPTGYTWDGFLDDTLVEDEYITNPHGVRILKTWQAHKMDEAGEGYEEEQENAVKVGADYIGPRYYTYLTDRTGHLTADNLKEVTYKNGIPTNIPQGLDVPFYISERPSKSAGDIDSRATYSDGMWLLELKRRLVTGNPDDVQFDTNKLYWFSIAINDDSHGAANDGRGQGHSISLLAKTLEFGGLGLEEVAKMGLLKDYLTTAKAYVVRDEVGLAASEINYAIALFQESGDEIAFQDPALYLHIKDDFTQAKRVPTVENIDALIMEVDRLIATLQGKRIPPEATLTQTFLVIWGTIQVYVFIILAIMASYPLYRSIKIGQKKVFKKMSILLFLVMVPMVLEGLGRVGTLLGISFLHGFSFMTSEFATLLWAWLMFLALFFARAGFGEIDRNIHLLEEHRALLRVKVKERTKEAEEARTFLEGVFNGIGEGVVVLDKDYNIISVNKAYLEMVGRPKDEVAGSHCYEMSHHRDSPCEDQEHHCPVRETFKSKRPSQALHTHYDRHGKEMYVEVSSYPLIDRNSKVKYVIESVIDITDKKKLEMETLRARDETIKQMRRHEDYVFDVADGLRNPLQVFMNHLAEFDTTNFSGDQAKSFDVILEALRLVEQNIKRLTKREGRENYGKP